MTFVAAPVASPTIAVDDAIAIDTFYPALSIAAFRDAQRIGTTVTDGRVRDALIGAVISSSIALAAWRQGIASGVASLAAVPAPTDQPSSIGGEARAVVLWRRSVYAFAAADLVDTHNDITATEPMRDRQMERVNATDDLRRAATIAIRDLIGRGRAKVALI